MPAHKLYENRGATAMWRRHCCKGARKQSCKRGKEAVVGASSERTPVPAIPVPEIQDWKLPNWVRARNTFKEISQGSGRLSKYLSDVHVPSAYIRLPKRCHLKLRERRPGKWWLLHHHRPQEEALGGSNAPTPALQNVKCLPRRCAPPVLPGACQRKGLWERADPFSLNLGVIYRLCCWETSVKANFGKPGREMKM